MRIGLLATMMLLTSTWAFAQESLLEAVTRQINDDTVIVVHLNLKTLNASPEGTSFANMFDPVQPLSHIANSLDQALAKLKPLKVSDVYGVLATTDLPFDGVLLIPTSNPRAVVEALKSQWPNDVEEFAGSVIAGSAQARARLRTAKAAPRPEFAKAMQSIRGTAIRVAVAPSRDSRRVIREFLPALPEPFGGGALAKAVDDTTWLAVGANVPPKVELQMIVQGTDPAVIETLRGMIEKLVTMAFQSDLAKKLLPKANELPALFTPKRDNNRLSLVLNEANGGAKRLTEEVLPPLVEAARVNSLQQALMGNMKHLGLAMHNYHDANKAFPPAASQSKDGKQKLLSWRVLILPYLDPELHKQFHLDEPWDSPHNKQLITKMPAFYETANTTAEQRRQGMTTLLVPVGPKTVFGQAEGVRIREITDGTSNTIMIVDAAGDRAAIWTKPDDFVFNPEKPWEGLGKADVKRFLAAFCDGSVRRLDETTNAVNLRRYFQMNDDELIDR